MTSQPTHRTFVVVDPGKKGAIAWSNRQGVGTEVMPATRRDLINLFRVILLGAVQPVAYIEKVVPYIPDGGASQMFVYGRQVERPGCILEMMDIRVIEIPPQRWQKELGLGNSERIQAPRMPKKLSIQDQITWRSKNKLAIQAAKAHNSKAKRDWKNKLKEEAQRRYPSLPVTLDNCDALLLLDAAIKMEGEKLNL